MTDIEITTATLDDVPGILPLLNQLFLQEADFTPDSAKQRSGVELILNSPETGRIFLAKRADRTIGMVSLLFTVSTAEGGKAGLIEDMIVTPTERGRGVGDRLLRHAIDSARKMRLTRLTLLTDGDNSKAQAFYVRHGFALSNMIPLRKYL